MAGRCEETGDLVRRQYAVAAGIFFELYYMGAGAFLDPLELRGGVAEERGKRDHLAIDGGGGAFTAAGSGGLNEKLSLLGNKFGSDVDEGVAA